MSKVFPFACDYVCRLFPAFPRFSTTPPPDASFHLSFLLHLALLLNQDDFFFVAVAELKVPIRDFRLNYLREHTSSEFV